jgi:hypothetical protein
MSFPVPPSITGSYAGPPLPQGRYPVIVLSVRTSFLLWAVAVSICLLGSAARADDSKAETVNLTVFPPSINLDGPRDEQRLVVIGECAEQTRKDLTRTCKFVSTAPDVAAVDGSGFVRPIHDGDAVITIEAAGKKAQVPIHVRRSQEDAPVNFSPEVIPILTQAGCNQGACHGGQHGKNGFKLSLRGFDPAFDYVQIVQSAEGRRVVLADPERSVLLLKPTLTMEHGGGQRFAVNSRSYNTLKQWLEDGAPGPTPQDATVTGLEAWPAKRLMSPGDEQQIVVRAKWSDGRSSDVTSTAQFDSLNDAVATVTPAGLVTAKERGETHIMVRFGGQVAVTDVTSPYARLKRYPDVPRNSFVDDKLIAKWKDLGLTPSPLCSDEDFYRRIHLDIIGTLPSPASIKAFLADKSPDKRSRAIDQVLAHPEFVDFWTLKWGDLLRINRTQLNEKGMWSFDNWIRTAIRENKPIDEFVRDIVTAEGSTFTDGPANFYRVGNNATDWSEATSQLFLGIRLQCAKCHHHPWEKWSQDDYYGMAAFFVRLGSKNSREFGLFGGERITYLNSTGEINNPRTGAVVKPHPLDGSFTDDPFDRRRKLADWITSPKNPFLARNIVNRFWGYLMGRGLVEPIDDMRATNPASSPELLDALAQDFINAKFDLKHLLKTIMNSRAYQLASTATPGNQADTGNVNCTHYTIKRLSAEELADALDFATGTKEKYPGLPPGTRAIQLPDSEVRSFLLDVFGRPARKVSCECERSGQPNIAQALHLLNGDFLNRKIASTSGRIETLFKNNAPLPAIVEDLYLATVSRPPRAPEMEKALAWLKTAPTPKEGAQDLLWVLLNSREFLFNH